MQKKDDYTGNPLNVQGGDNSAFIPNAQDQSSQKSQMGPQGQQSQQQGQQSQIGAKELSMLEDMLNHEAMAYKKCTVFANYFNDETLNTMVSSAASHHKQHFEALQSYMSQHQ